MRIVKALAVVAAAAAIIVPADALNVAMFSPDAHPVTAPQIEYAATQIDTARRCMAIAYIEGAILSGNVEEDWSYKGGPAVVNEWNDALIHEYNEQDTIQDAEMWLAQQNTDCTVHAYGNPEGI